jgi:uncharacterized protein (DUF934 family)
MRTAHTAARLGFERLTMPIFKGDAFVPDDWHNLAQEEDLPPSGKFIVTLAQWQAINSHRPSCGACLGLLIGPGQDLRTIALDLPRIPLVAVAFPKFTDGRGYSLGRKLRSHYGFGGELRATGDILFDQLQLLARCGFDSFDVRDETTIRLLEAGRRPGFKIFYQPSVAPEVPERTRPWARRTSS